MRSIVVLASVAVAAAASCGGGKDPVVNVPGPSTVVMPARSIHLRATFDDDPSTYVGRFVPDGTARDGVDENAAATTRCSKFFKPKVVSANQQMDEVMYVSRQASASLGIPPVAKASASSDSSSTLRVKYTITKKIQVDTDAEGLDACCKADPKQCSGSIIGEFVRGTGEILQASSASDAVSAGAVTPKVTAGGDYKDSTAWKRVSTFTDVYFAFQTTATPGRLAGSPGPGPDDCSWCETLPGSLDGKYFCGVSPDAPSESMARDLAMRHAREQVVKFLGEYLTTQSKTTASSISGYIDDQQLVTAAAQGLASRVKDEKWCKAATVPTPDGQKYRSRVLAFFPNAQTQAAAKDAIESFIATRKAAGKLTAEQEAAMRGLANGLK